MKKLLLIIILKTKNLIKSKDFRNDIKKKKNEGITKNAK